MLKNDCQYVGPQETRHETKENFFQDALNTHQDSYTEQGKNEQGVHPHVSSTKEQNETISGIKLSKNLFLLNFRTKEFLGYIGSYFMAIENLRI